MRLIHAPFACSAVVTVLLAGAVPAAGVEVLVLDGGFQPDPVRVEFAATGRDAAEDRVRGCPGYADSAPALVTTLSGANARLHLYLVGDGAAGFLALGPDGIFRCEVPDENGITRARFERIESGEYVLWPLAAEPGAEVAGSLLVSEIDLGPRDVASATGLELDSALQSQAPAAALDPQAEPASGRLTMPEAGTAEVVVAVSGTAAADQIVSGCAGAIEPGRPDVTLTLPARETPLWIGATADFDTTLLVAGPDGYAYCNDDMDNFDPAVEITDAQPGDYAIWVGTWTGGDGLTAVLSVGREQPGAPAASAVPAALDTAAEPASGRHALPGEGALELPVTLAGDVHAENFAPGCSGAIDPARPDAVITLSATEAEVWFHAASESADTTLVVLAPDGTPYCNDDFDSFNPAVAVAGAQPGDYSVWIGNWGGSSGAEATLAVGREAPGGGAAAGDGGMAEANPFIGQPIGSAADAMALMVESLGLAEFLAYERMEETGPEGLILHGVVLSDPAGVDEPVRIGSVVVSDLDLAGLSAYGAPERFSVGLHDISYDSVAKGAQSFAVPLPLLEAAPPLSLTFSLLPPGGDASRRELRFGLGLDGQIALAFTAGMLWEEGLASMGPAATMLMAGDSLELELHDMGFLGAVLREMAAESGESVEALVAQGLQEMAAGLEPLTEGSPRARLFQAVSARLGDLDRPGVLRVRLSAAEARDAEAMFEAMMADSLDGSGIDLDVTYQPDQ